MKAYLLQYRASYNEEKDQMILVNADDIDDALYKLHKHDKYAIENSIRNLTID